MTKTEYDGLYGEVVIEDVYKLRSLKFVPDIVFDFGANVGIFSRYAQELWPGAFILAVEPDPINIDQFRANTKDIDLMEVAIGHGELYHNLGARNGSGEVYISKGLGYPEGGDVVSEIPIKMPDEIIKGYWRKGLKSVVKIDIEGGENAIWGHKPSMDILRKMDFVCMEVHFYASTHELLQEVSDKTMAALNSFRKTHEVLIESVHFWAWKKQKYDTI